MNPSRPPNHIPKPDPSLSPNHYPSLSVVIPMYREQDSVAPLIECIHQGLRDYPGRWELICVDDGSPDHTVAELRHAREQYGPHIHIIELQRNFGQTAAMQAGIDASRAELIATLDGDLQNDPADIPRMVSELLARDLDLLQGWRQDRQDAAISRKLPSRFANALIAKVTGIALHDYGCSLKIYRTAIIRQVRLYGDMHRFIPVWMAGVTLPSRISETVVSHHARQFGQSNYGIGRTILVIIDLISAFFFLRYRARPGHFFGSIGLATGSLGGVMLSWLLAVKFLLGEDIGHRPMLMIAVLLILVGMQLITTGVIAEMLSRIFFQGNNGRNFVTRPYSSPQSDDGWHSSKESPL